MLKAAWPIMKNILKPLAKSVLIPLGLTVAGSATFGSSVIRLIISNEEMNDMMKIVKSFEDAGLLIKGVSKKKSKIKQNNKKVDFSACY